MLESIAQTYGQQGDLTMAEELLQGAVMAANRMNTSLYRDAAFGAIAKTYANLAIASLKTN